MGLVNSVLNLMNLNADEDDYDDDILEEEDVLEDEDDVEESPRRSIFRRNRVAEESIEEEKVKPAVKEKEEKPKATPKVTPFRPNNNKGKQVVDMGVCVIKPTSVEDAREVTETLLKGRTVVLNMEGVNLDVAQRIIDFTSGSTFAIGGNLQKVSGFIFIITPPNVEISGDFADLFSAYESGIHADL